jgi:hypothetical protein
MRKFLVTAAIAVSLAASALAGPTSAMSLVQAIKQNAKDVLFNDYKIIGLNVIERRENGTIVVKVTTQTGSYTITYRNGESVIGENPCYEQYGGFHVAVPVGNSFTCVYDPSMYVSTIVETQPSFTVTDRNDPACDISTKTTTKTGKHDYTITEVTSQTAGNCKKKW